MENAKQLVPIMIKVAFGGLTSKLSKMRETMDENTGSRLELEKKGDAFSKLILDCIPKHFDQSPLRKNSFVANFHDIFRVNFDSIYTDKEIHKFFEEYLLKDDNHSLEFFAETSKIKSLSQKEQNSKFVYIVETFVGEKAIKKVPLCKKDQEIALNFLKDAKEEKLEFPHQTLNELKEILEWDLKVDYFPKFIRAKEIQNLFNKHSNDSKIMIPTNPTELLVDDSYFNKLHLTKRDIDFALKLSEDGFDWEHLQGSRNLNIYYSKNNYLPNSEFFKGCHCIKGQMMLNNGIYSVLAGMDFDTFSKTFTSYGQCTVKYHSKESLQKMNPDEEIFESCYEYQQVFQLPMLMSTNRKTVATINFIHLQKENVYMLIVKPYLGKLKINDEKIDWSKRQKFKDEDFEGYYVSQYHCSIFKPIGNNMTLATHIKMFDLRGFLTNTKQMVPLMMKFMFPAFKDNITKRFENSNFEDQRDSLKESKDPFIQLMSEVIKKEMDELNKK